MPSWHPPDSDSGSVQDDESIIKVHNDAKTRFSWIWPFGIWTSMPNLDTNVDHRNDLNKFYDNITESMSKASEAISLIIIVLVLTGVMTHIPYLGGMNM